MCGIAGFISYNKNYESELIVNKMLNKIKHRGPNQTGFKKYNDVTLGMVRLSIIDETPHDIPLEDISKQYAIIYNGEIYNHNIIKGYYKNDYSFKTNTDTETALVSYIFNGIDSFKEHNGMYAFAIHDKEQAETILVRDKSGEKPLYYSYSKDYFIFASEIKALLTFITPEFNSNALSYEAFEFTVGRETLFKNIFSLEPGEYIKIKTEQDNLKISQKNYWKIWDNLLEIPDNKNKIINELSGLLEDSILLRTQNSAYDYTAFISGGVDSSLIACIAKPDRLYTAHYDYDDFDELDYAKLVAKHINKKLHIVKPNKEDFLNTREKIIYHLDTPCTWTSFTLWMLLETAYKDGVKIIMSGEGADEMFSGYHRYILLYHDEQIHKLKSMEKYSYLINKYYGDPVDRYLKLINRCENPYNERVNMFLRKTLRYIYENANNDILNFMGLTDFYTTMQVLLQMSDRLSMAFSIENRSPFLDYRLMQFAFSMPSKYKIKNGIAKWILKEVAKKFIPKQICERIDKRGFSAPVNKWFKWDKFGKYNRSIYKKMVFEDWQKVFQVKNV